MQSERRGEENAFLAEVRVRKLVEGQDAVAGESSYQSTLIVRRKSHPVNAGERETGCPTLLLLTSWRVQSLGPLNMIASVGLTCTTANEGDAGHQCVEEAGKLGEMPGTSVESVVTVQHLRIPIWRQCLSFEARAYSREKCRERSLVPPLMMMIQGRQA